MIQKVDSDVFARLLKEALIRGFSVEHFSRYRSINISPKWCNQSTIIPQGKRIRCKLRNLIQEGNNAIGVYLHGEMYRS